jgi:energy-coupling factor transporter ATP-binding protein EcfA2
MTQIIDIVNQIAGSVVNSLSKRIVIVLDVSGSTGNIYINKQNVLDKEIELAEQYMLKNPKNKYILVTFDDNVRIYDINILEQEQMTNIYDLGIVPGSSTYTARAFAKVNSMQNNPDAILLFTDGQTNSSRSDILKETNQFSSKNIPVNVVAVSTSNINLLTVSSGDERQIPGMDLLNYMGNTISSLTIYNRFHNDTPYIGAVTSNMNRQNLSFMNVPITGFVHEFLRKLIELFKTTTIEWEADHRDFKRFLTEIGKFFSVLFINFPEDNIFVESLINDISSSCNIDGFSLERITTIIKYGFSCARSGKPIMLTNFEERVKESTVKKAEFAGATALLNSQGTTLMSDCSICLPTNGVCVEMRGNSLELTQPLREYPNSGDKFGNIYFGCDANPQAIRIAMRTFGSTQGFRNPMSHPVIFYVAKEMSLMMISGHSLDSPHMLQLQKLAIIQTSLETMVRQNMYSGVGCYIQWKNGTLPLMHFSETKTHTSLYSDPIVNPLGLTEPLWWALMMSMLGIFNEQLNNYAQALSSLNIQPTQEAFIAWVRQTYSPCIEGLVSTVTVQPNPTSIFSLSEFENLNEVYVLKNHGNCRTRTHYELSEIQSYVLTSGCVWCHHIPTMDDFERVVIGKPEQMVEEALSLSRRLTINQSKLRDINSQLGFVFNTETDVRLIQVNLIGITGAGKSTFAQKLSELIEQKGGKTLIISADKHSKQGKKGRAISSAIENEMRAFGKLKSKLKIVIVDLCNENGPSPNCFGLDFSSYEKFDVYPNMNVQKFDEYEAWCLRNVLSRPLHTNDSLYWLNPVSAGVNTCIKVHRLKSDGVRRLKVVTAPRLFLNESWTMQETLDYIKVKADSYTEYLAASSVQNDVENFLREMNIS